MEVLVLEDNDVRFYCMQKALERRNLPVRVQRWSTSADMITALEEPDRDDCVISLDLHLSAKDATGNNDSGKNVVNAFLQRRPFCEVIIHSSSDTGATGVINSLLIKGWTVPSMCRGQRP